jgi:site-specific DNA recombinase
VQEQLRENQRRCRQRAVGTKYLLQGLILCKVCGYALSGTTTGKRIRDNLHYGYYRCLGSEPHRFGGNRICDNRPVATDKIELAVWQEVRRLLEDPARVTDEYRRRLQPETESKHSEIVSIESRMSKLRNGLARLIDSYADGLIEKSEFEPRVKEVRERLEALHRQAEELRDQASLETDLRLVVSTLEQFTSRVKDGLDQADWASKREIIRALVKRVEVERDGVSVVFRVNPLPFDPRPERGNKPHCWRGQIPLPD